MRRVWMRVVGIAAAGAAAAAAAALPAAADSAPVDPTNPASPTTVTADPLPTVQVDGVVWSQVVVGNTVYAGGSFTTARPAGAVAGTNTVSRTYLLAYDITTGALISSFAPVLDGQVRSLAVSPDGTRVYATGDFTHVNGAYRVRIAAFSTTDGSLVAGFRPSLGTSGLAVAATNTTVYVGGNFTKVAPVTGATLVARSYLAAFDASTGAISSFSADADAPVTALAVTTDGGRLVVGGRFTTLRGTSFRGLGSVDPTTGTAQSLSANQYVWDYGTQSAITTLVADGSGVYGGGYVYNKNNGNTEGSFRIDSTTGALIWVADCHGDTYSVWPQGDTVYVASHEHYCGNLGGFPQTTPWTYYRATAFSKAATGANAKDIYGYPSHTGQPSPTLLTFFPDLAIGTYTGQAQAAWSVAGNSDYIVYGGEFPSVNGTAQQGLVRFARSALATNAQGPQLSGTSWSVSAASSVAGRVQVSFPTNWDRDNATLTYKLFRGSESTGVVAQKSVTATFWQTKTVTLQDQAAPPGTTQQYEVVAVDAFGNVARSAWVSVAVASSPIAGAYGTTVLNDGAANFWRLDETGGSTVLDWAGGATTTAGFGVNWGRSGALVGDLDTAAGFGGTSRARVSTSTSVTGPETFSVETWFKTTTASARQIVGFGSSSTGNSSTSDRSLSTTSSGQLVFTVAPGGSTKTVTSSAAYRDGGWHQAVATLGSDGMKLYVDGTLVAQRADVTSAAAFNGYWRIGGDQNKYFNGTLDEVAVYPAALSASQVAYHYGVARATVNAAPTAAITTAANGLALSVDGNGSSDPDGTVAAYAWDFGDGSTGSDATASHTYAAGGTYTVTLTVTDNRGATASTTASVTVVRPPTAGDPIASDGFARTTFGGWGAADLGGSWAVTSTSAFSTTADRGVMTFTTGGSTLRARLTGTQQADTDVAASVSLPSLPTSGTTRVWTSARMSSDLKNEYMVKANIATTGVVSSIELSKRVGGTETRVALGAAPGITLAAGEQLRMRLSVVGTTLQGKVWKVGTTEPATWQVVGSDADVSAAGGVGVGGYVAATAAPLPISVAWDDLAASIGG